MFKSIAEKFQCWLGKHSWDDWWISLYTEYKYKHRNCKRKNCRGHQVVKIDYRMRMDK